MSSNDRRSKNTRSRSSSGLFGRSRGVGLFRRANSSSQMDDSAGLSLPRRNSRRNLANPIPDYSFHGNSFEARPSARRTTEGPPGADQDVWVEMLAVVETPVDNGRNRSAVPQMKIRSYFQSQITGRRLWDEPASGASRVEFATEEMRLMAETQLRDLQSVAPAILTQNDHSDDRSVKSERRGSFFSRFRRNDANGPKKKPQRSQSFRGMRRGSRKSAADETLDVDMQRAIAMSMGAEGALEPDYPGHSGAPVHLDSDMAYAMSLSEAEAKPADDEVLLRAVMEESRKEATKVNQMQEDRKPSHVDLLSMESSQIARNDAFAAAPQTQSHKEQYAAHSAPPPPPQLPNGGQMYASFPNEQPKYHSTPSEHQELNGYPPNNMEHHQLHSGSYAPNEMHGGYPAGHDYALQKMDQPEEMEETVQRKTPIRNLRKNFSKRFNNKGHTTSVDMGHGNGGLV